MNRKNNESESSQKNAPEPGSHLPPDLNRAEVGRAKDVEADLDAQQPEDPILQMRENPRRKRKRQSSG
jgi:hypothetical protein